MCLHSDFSKDACIHAKEVLAGHKLDDSLVSPVCKALLHTTRPGEVQAHSMSLAQTLGAMLQRSSQGAT